MLISIWLIKCKSFYYRASRLYWSTIDPKKRVRYYFTVQQKKNVESPSTKEHEDKHKLEDIHKVIVHDESRDTKQKEKRTLIRTPAYCDTEEAVLSCPVSSHEQLDVTSKMCIKEFVDGGKTKHVSDKSGFVKSRKSYLMPAAVSPGAHNSNVIKPRVYPTLAPKLPVSPISTSKFANNHRTLTGGVMKPSSIYSGLSAVYHGLQQSSLISGNSLTFSSPSKSSSKPIHIYPKPPSNLMTTYPNFVVNKNSPCPQQSYRLCSTVNKSSTCSFSVINEGRCLSTTVNSGTSNLDFKACLPSCPKSPYSSPRKIVSNIQQQSSAIPSMLNRESLCQDKDLRNFKSGTTSSSEHSPKEDFNKIPSNANCSETPKRGRKTTSKTYNTSKRSSRDKKCGDEVSNFFQYEHEVVSTGETMSPEKNISNLVGGGKDYRPEKSDSPVEQLMVTFIITNDEGLRIEAESCQGELIGSFHFFKIISCVLHVGDRMPLFDCLVTTLTYGFPDK